MGYMRHHAILVTSWDGDKIEIAHKRAEEIFRAVSPIMDSSSNRFRSFFIPPDGSKENWGESDAGDSLRDVMIDWLDEQAYPDGSTSFDWVEVQYGDDNGDVLTLRHPVCPRCRYAIRRTATDPSAAEENDG